ncbi:MAG: CHASE3 domain-containing protein [Betaproteobacteria bacterium]
MSRHALDNLYDRMLSRLGLFFLGLAFVVNIGALIFIDAQLEKLEQARESVRLSRAVAATVQDIYVLLTEAESGQRGFLYTDNKDYLKPVIENDSQITSKLDTLRTLAVDNPAQVEMVTRVQTIAREKMKELNKSIAIQQMGQRDAAKALVMTDQGRQLMEDLDLEVTRFLSREDVVREQRVAKWEDILAAIRWGFFAVLFINVLLLLAGVNTITRDLRRRRAQVVLLDERATELASEVSERAAELRALTVHLQRVQEEERRTIARELHDELGGTLSAVKMDILMGRDAASKRGDEKSVMRMQRAIGAIDGAIQFNRRLIEDLRPTLLDNLGFEAALRSMTEQFSDRTGCHCTITLPDGELNLTPAQSTALYRICQEALTNVMKYAKAHTVRIALTNDGSFWRLVLADDGVGLEATKQMRSISHGLVGMRERLLALDGTFDIRGAAGEGTTLTATFPVVAPDGDGESERDHEGGEKNSLAQGTPP